MTDTDNRTTFERAWDDQFEISRRAFEAARDDWKGEHDDY